MANNDKNSLHGELPGNMVFGVQGENAYQVAVRNGFNGTVEQWLASLHGEKGDSVKVALGTFDDSFGSGVTLTVTNFRSDGSFSSAVERIYNGTNGVTPRFGTVRVESIGADEEPSGSISGPSNFLTLNLKIPKCEMGKDGVDGKDGYTPVKYVDYWTDADQTAIVNATLAALPTWTGGSY